MTRPEIMAANDASRARLQRMFERATDADLARELPTPGWTVGVALAHLALWERRAAILLAKAAEGETINSPYDPDVINDAVFHQQRLIPPRLAAHEALAAAEAIDAAVAAADDQTVERCIASGNVRVDRSRHRNSHLDEIESHLGWS